MRGRQAELCRDLSVGGRTVCLRGGSCWSWLLPEGAWKVFILCWRVKGSLGSSEKRPRLAQRWFGLNAANATLRWSGTAVCITSLILQMMLVPFAHLCFLPSVRLRQAHERGARSMAGSST